MKVKTGRFSDAWRGNGWYVSIGGWTLAFRWRWHFYFIRPLGKPGYCRLYIGPIEIERK